MMQCGHDNFVVRPDRWHLKEPPSEVSLDDEPGVKDDDEALEAPRRICCARCRAHLSDRSCIAGVLGYSAQRVVSNPAGVMFEIITVLDAWSVLKVGPASTDFSWYKGAQWTVTSCANCGLHLGWFFEVLAASSPLSFYGLVASSIVEEEP